MFRDIARWLFVALALYDAHFLLATSAEFFGWDEVGPGPADEQYARIHEKLHGHRQGP